MEIQAQITPTNILNEVSKVKTIDVSSCMTLFKRLLKSAECINNNKDSDYKEIAKLMSLDILKIKEALMSQLEKI
jgi:predicted transcriptional regulator